MSERYAWRVFERFTDRARRVLTLAQEEARLLNHSFIGTEHILLGVMREGDGVGAEALRSLGVSLDVVRVKVVEIVGASTSIPGGPPPFTPRAKKVLEVALREALQLNHSYIGTEHILLGLMREREGVAATVLANLGVDLSRVRQTVNTLMTGRSDPQVGKLVEEPSGTMLHEPRQVEPSCSRCLTSLADAAQFRTVSVPADDESTPPVSMSVVYCTRCGSTLHMFGRDPNS
jgi:ATP-dependent Clp protease ATP-binding subunit ClpC